MYGFNLQGNYPPNMPEKHLTTTAIDCSDVARVELRFWRWLNVEEAIYDHASISVSNDGQTFHTVWKNSPTLTDSSWQQIKLDLSKHADGQPTVYVRWTMGSTDEGLHMSGWNIDDIAIWGIRAQCDDVDGDGALPPECGGNDCHDGDPNINPSAGENCTDGIDNDCDGAIDSADIDCGGSDGEPPPPNSNNNNNNNPNSLDPNGKPWGLQGVVCACRFAGNPGDSHHSFAWLLLAAALLARRTRHSLRAGSGGS